MMKTTDQKVDSKLAIGTMLILTVFAFSIGIMTGGAVKPDQIQNDNFEEVMLRESIESYNASITAYENNHTQQGYELAESGTMHLWALMHTQDDASYDEVFKVVTIRCLADLNRDQCPSIIPQARDNLDQIYEEKGFKGNTTSP